MAGNNVITATSISPVVVSSAQLSTADSAVYTVPGSTSVKVATASICNVTANLVPVLTLGTPSTTGGTFAAGTFFWKITAKTGTGESLASNEVTATLTGTTSSQPLSWPLVPTATSYNIYRGTSAGNENVLVANVTTLSYTDTGTAGSAATLPVQSTFGSAVGVYLSIVQTGGTVGDGTHRIMNSYQLAVNDTFDLSMLRGAMLGPGDKIAGFSTAANAVDFVITGTVHA